MDIATFRVTKARMLEQVPSHFHHTIEERIQLVLDLLGQETTSRETIATIIALCTK